MTPLYRTSPALLLTVLLSVAGPSIHAQILDDVKNNVKQTATQKTDDKANSSTTNTMNKADSTLDKGYNKLKGLFKKKKKDPATAAANNNTGAATNTTNTGNGNPAGGNASAAGAAPVPPLTLYSNYDFVPGDQVLFEDHFTDDQDGEFPAHWKLNKGQGILNKINGETAFCLTEGNYVRVAPRMKTEDNYLPDNFTIEFDLYFTPGSYAPLLLFSTADNSSRNIQFGKEVGTGYFPNDLSANYPGDQDNFENKWHHAAMVKKGNQIKCYLDQYRVLVIPDCGSCAVTSVEVGGIGSRQDPIVFKNFRLAAGGNMNMIGKKFTDAKIVTHGINFDVNQATIKPESMGTLNMIVQVMKDNPDVKFEIDGHTDNTGDPAGNLSLSQQRSESVKTQLINMGIDPGRLTTRGLGDTKPIADNSTPEGRANNRRVEFVKM